MWSHSTHRLAILGLLILSSASTSAQTKDSITDPTIDFDQAIARTLESNPALLSFGFQVEAQHGRIRQSQLTPSIELAADIENIAGTGGFSGVEGSEATISLAWSLERGKRKLRSDSALAGLTLLEAEKEQMQLDAAAATARLYLETLADQDQLEIADLAVEFATATVDNVKKRVQAGRTPKADLARAEVELSRAKLEREELEHQLRTDVRRLAAQWGETDPQFKRVAGTLASLPTPDSFPQLLSRIDENRDLRRLVSERRLREAELRQAQGEDRPDIRLTAGIRQLQLSDDQAFVAGVSIPLGSKKRNLGRTAVARAEIARVDAEQVAARVQVETLLFALYEELKHSIHRANTLRGEILPRAEAALTETQRAYNLGRYTYFELRTAQNEALLAKADYIAALIDAHRQIIEIEALTGAALSTPAQ